LKKNIQRQVDDRLIAPPKIGPKTSENATTTEIPAAAFGILEVGISSKIIIKHEE
jgi:hypothetical protein